MLKRLLICLMSICMFFHTILPVKAYKRHDHDEDIEYVLFYDPDYITNCHNEDIKKKIIAIEDAVYLCVDQFNGEGETSLKNLNSRKIPGIPKEIKEIDYPGSGNTHRGETHRGWNMVYTSSTRWQKRKDILINTVNEELFSNINTSLDWFPWLDEKVNGNYTKRQCESFCVLLYYTHIIGDHLAAKGKGSLALVAPLTRPNDPKNPGIIPELINAFKVLFQSQKSSRVFKSLIMDLEDLKDRSDKLVSAEDNVNTDEEFAEYHEIAIELLNCLGEYVPKLLKNENFYKETFNK